MTTVDVRPAATVCPAVTVDLYRPLLLDPGFSLSLRPMRYPAFYNTYKDAIRNTWSVEEVDLGGDLADLARLSPAERHLVHRLVARLSTRSTTSRRSPTRRSSARRGSTRWGTCGALRPGRTAGRSCST